MEGGVMAGRVFSTGATRDEAESKLDYEGFESPLVRRRFAEYMHQHRQQPDGSIRASDNWQLGIEKEAYVKSLIRHMEDFHLHWDGYADLAKDPDIESVCCAVLFNIKGFLFEVLREKRQQKSLEKPSSETVEQLARAGQRRVQAQSVIEEQRSEYATSDHPYPLEEVHNP